MPNSNSNSNKKMKISSEVKNEKKINDVCWFNTKRFRENKVNNQTARVFEAAAIRG